MSAARQLTVRIESPELALALGRSRRTRAAVAAALLREGPGWWRCRMGGGTVVATVSEGGIGQVRYYFVPPAGVTVEAAAAYSGSWFFARFAFASQLRRMSIMNAIYFTQTLGGGWASVRNAAKSLMCAVQLYRLAVLINDDTTLRKCRLFLGYACLWSGAAGVARRIFLSESSAATTASDEMQRNRCDAAVFQLLYNPEYRQRRGRGGSAPPPRELILNEVLAVSPTAVDATQVDQAWEVAFRLDGNDAPAADGEASTTAAADRAVLQ